MFERWILLTFNYGLIGWSFVYWGSSDFQLFRLCTTVQIRKNLKFYHLSPTKWDFWGLSMYNLGAKLQDDWVSVSLLWNPSIWRTLRSQGHFLLWSFVAFRRLLGNWRDSKKLLIELSCPWLVSVATLWDQKDPNCT